MGALDIDLKKIRPRMIIKGLSVSTKWSSEYIG
jgi:hypothetical protein